MQLTLEQLPPDFLEALKVSIGEKFELTCVIGGGKNGVTFKALAPNNRVTYCLKTIHPDTISENRRDAAVRSLRKEVDILSPLQHRCLPEIVYDGIGDSFPYYVCTFHPGRTSYQIRHDTHKYPLEQSIFVISSLIDAFEYLHKAGRTHCDAHQDNILIGANVFADGLMIIDFGSGHRQSAPEPDTPDKGALHFKPPEAQARHQRPVDRAAAARDFERYDLTAVGVLLSVMRDIFFADATLSQLDEYDSFCSDLQNGRIDRWSSAKYRLKFVVDPFYLRSSLDRYHQHDEKKTIHIPTSSPIRIGIPFDDLIATKAFQKLKSIKQLSFCDWVFPGAVHSRLEHSLGVFQTAVDGVDHLCSMHTFRRAYDEVHVASLLLAALLHDVGHYPFAHVVEHYVSARYGADQDLIRYVSHSHASRTLIESDPQIARTIRDHFSDDHITETINILNGSREFLSALLDSPIDFDKIDYLKRDSYHCGIAYGSGYNTRELVEAIRYLPPHKNIFLAEENAHAVVGFLVLQSQMLARVYWNENIRAIFAMFHRFIDVCLLEDKARLRNFVLQLRESNGDAEAFATVFRPAYDAFCNNTENPELPRQVGAKGNFDDPLWRLISILRQPDPNLVYRCVNRFSYSDSSPNLHGARQNVFQTIIKAPLGSTVSGGSIEWEQVKKLRCCYLATLSERKLNPNLLDVLVDIPWGKGSHEPLTFVDPNGARKALNEVSHLSPSIFTDLTIFAAPIRVFVSPQLFDFVVRNPESVNNSALEKYFDSHFDYKAWLIANYSK